MAVDHGLDSRVYALLGNIYPVQFYQLTSTQQDHILRRHLVQDAPVFIDEAGLLDEYRSPRLANAYYLLRDQFIGTDDWAELLAAKSRSLYYGANRFVVPLYCLQDFMAFPDTSEPGILPAPLVGGITVEVDLRDGGDDDGGGGSDGVYTDGHSHKITKQQLMLLMRLFQFTGATQVAIVLQTGGALNGSDLVTHQTIQHIASMVDQLITQFGDGFDIMIRVEGRIRREQSILRYWDEPTEAARDKVREGVAEFNEVVQVEIDNWSHHRLGDGYAEKEGLPWQTWK